MRHYFIAPFNLRHNVLSDNSCKLASVVFVLLYLWQNFNIFLVKNYNTGYLFADIFIYNSNVWQNCLMRLR